MNKHRSFGELRLAAVQSFVRTAILIDNEPTAASPLGPEVEPMVAVSAAYGAEAVSALQPRDAEALGGSQAALPINAAPKTGDAGHRLWVQPVTNGFANRRITCGFYFPANDEGSVVSTALNAARHVDATIVDWQLRPNDTTPARELIAELIKDDRSAGGRLRLIVVYTGERGIDRECKDLHDYLRAQGFDDLVPEDQDRALRGRNVLITFANKPRALEGGLGELAGPGARPIPWGELPAFVLGQYASLTKGLLQSFALKAIGAVRDDTHHLLSVFDPDLDGAFLAQRAGIGSPTDAEEMMTGLLTSEFACSILDRGVATEILGPHGAVHVLEARAAPATIKVKKYETAEMLYKKIVQTPVGGSKSIKADKVSLTRLVEVGLDSGVIELKSDEIKSLKKQFFPDDMKALTSLSNFARMALFCREAAGERRITREAIYLTGGVILRSVAKAGKAERYLLCVQPGCDAVRLTEDTAFPFCPLVPGSATFDLVLRVDGEDKYLKVDRTPRNLTMIKFTPHAKKKCVTPKLRKSKIGFASSADGVFWEFVAELRPPESQHFTTLLVGKFNRVALNGSEWLRLHGSGGG